MADPFAGVPSTPPVSSRSHASFGITAGLPVGGVAPPKPVRKKPPPDPNKPKKERKRKEPPPPDGSPVVESAPKKRKTAEPKKPATPRTPKTPQAAAAAPAQTPGATPTKTPPPPEPEEAEELSNEEVNDAEVLYSEAEVKKREEAGEDDDSDEEENEDDEMELDEAAQSQEKAARMHELIAQFNDDQLQRYETYRRSKLPHNAVKKIMIGVANCAVAPLAGVVMSGVAKLFVGELVELARSVQEEWARTGVEPMAAASLGPLKPIHLKEAYRRLKADGKLSYSKPPRLFKR